MEYTVTPVKAKDLKPTDEIAHNGRFCVQEILLKEKPYMQLLIDGKVITCLEDREWLVLVPSSSKSEINIIDREKEPELFTKSQMEEYAREQVKICGNSVEHSMPDYEVEACLDSPLPKLPKPVVLVYGNKEPMSFEEYCRSQGYDKNMDEYDNFFQTVIKIKYEGYLTAFTPSSSSVKEPSVYFIERVADNKWIYVSNPIRKTHDKKIYGYTQDPLMAMKWDNEKECEEFLLSHGLYFNHVITEHIFTNSSPLPSVVSSVKEVEIKKTEPFWNDGIEDYYKCPNCLLKFGNGDIPINAKYTPCCGNLINWV